MNTAEAPTRTLPDVPRRHVKAYWKGIRDYSVKQAYRTPEDEIGRQARLACQQWEARHGRRPSPKTLRTIAAVFAATEKLPDVAPEYLEAFRQGLRKYNPGLANDMPADKLKTLVTTVYEKVTAQEGRPPTPKEVRDVARLTAITAQLAAAGIDVSGFKNAEDYQRALKDPRLEEYLDKRIEAAGEHDRELKRERRAAKQAYREWRKGRRENDRKLKEARAELERIYSERDREIEKIDKELAAELEEIEQELQSELQAAEEEKMRAEKAIKEAEKRRSEAEKRKSEYEKRISESEENIRKSERRLRELNMQKNQHEIELKEEEYKFSLEMRKLEELEAERRRLYYREP